MTRPASPRAPARRRRRSNATFFRRKRRERVSRDDEWEEDEEPEPLPIWRQRKWLLIGLGVVVLLAFLFTRGKPQHAQEAAKGEEPFIGVVVPYQPAKPAPAPAHQGRRCRAGSGAAAADDAGLSRSATDGECTARSPGDAVLCGAA